ncbi:hypothetical protein L5515_006349 [Caenorhabditis briggsae]|uniref:PDZ domain-containing protein n=1 Tax=Caenorhabditis briggsae TaxID=6238 RepID=A0AAE9EVQ8_CAEBR|nr:hypothetical protein L5515_006349 [Caenorhabditis briggsae]
MSAEPVNLSREMKRAFRAGKFPEDIITKDMIREVTCTIDCAPGTPNYKEFKVTEGMLFTKVPDNLTPPLEFCDMLLKINGKAVTTKKQMHEEIYKLAKSNKSHYLAFTVKRIISCERLELRNTPSNASARKPASKDPAVKPNNGYTYYKIVLIYFPKSKLGINIKSYADCVYVATTDNLWGSTTRRLLFPCDTILKIDETLVFDCQTCQAALKNGFAKNGIVTLYIERPIGTSAIAFSHGVLSFNRKTTDPYIPEDVVQKCSEQLAYYEKNGFQDPPPIFRGYTKDYSSAGRVKVTNTVENKKIRSDDINPAILKPVPPQMSPKK